MTGAHTATIRGDEQAEPFWSEARVALITELRMVQHKTCSEIARVVGDNCTRNAVIGKLARLGFGKGHGRPYKITLTPPGPVKKIKLTPPALYRPSKTLRKGYRPRRLPRVTIPPPTTEFATLALRTGCAFPVNDGRPFLFCNENTENNLPYCPHHRQRMYVKGVAIS